MSGRQIERVQLRSAYGGSCHPRHATPRWLGRSCHRRHVCARQLRSVSRLAVVPDPAVQLGLIGGLEPVCRCGPSEARRVPTSTSRKLGRIARRRRRDLNGHWRRFRAQIGRYRTESSANAACPGNPAAVQSRSWTLVPGFLKGFLRCPPEAEVASSKLAGRALTKASLMRGFPLHRRARQRGREPTNGRSLVPLSGRGRRRAWGGGACWGYWRIAATRLSSTASKPPTEEP